MDEDLKRQLREQVKELNAIADSIDDELDAATRERTVWIVRSFAGALNKFATWIEARTDEEFEELRHCMSETEWDEED